MTTAVLIRRARKLYVNDDIGLDLANTVYALDSTTIDLCLGSIAFYASLAAFAILLCLRSPWTAIRQCAVRPPSPRAGAGSTGRSPAPPPNALTSKYPEPIATTIAVIPAAIQILWFDRGVE
jgi:hypothetical protein